MRNNLLSEKFVYTGTSDVSTRLFLCSYGSTEKQEAHGERLSDVIGSFDPARINWLQVYGMKDTETVREVCEHFEINFLTLQDILNAEHPTKIEEHDTYTFIILKLFDSDETDKDTGLRKQQLCIVQGANYILTFLENDTPFFENILTAIRNNILKICDRQADYLLSVQLNNVMANYMHIVSGIDDALEDLEEELLNISNSKDIGIQIQTLRRQYLQIKRAVLPLKEQYIKLLRSESTFMHKANRAFFNDVNDHLQFVLQTLEICRETLSSLVDLYISNNDLRMNDIMKRLTIVSTIFIPLTFLAGVWGMNFDFMPELGWKHGYLFAWLLMIFIGIAVFLYFKRKKWY